MCAWVRNWPREEGCGNIFRLLSPHYVGSVTIDNSTLCLLIMPFNISFPHKKGQANAMSTTCLAWGDERIIPDAVIK